MVRIRYYEDPTKDVTIDREYETVGHFILAEFPAASRETLLDLLFFDGEVLGHQIDTKTEHSAFIDVNEGVIAVTHDSMLPRDPATWGYIIVAVIFAAAAILLAPSIPDVSTDQQSSTNRLGDTNNSVRLNKRIDDIFGTVSKHMPSLWQVPYRIGVNNEETEVLFLCVGRGKYDINTNNWYDGDTPVVNIPNAAVSIYEPGTHPGNGSPAQQIGDLVTEPIGIYRQSNDLNPAELLPPNELENAGIKWQITGTATSATLTATSIPDGFKFSEYYTVGQLLTLSGVIYAADDGTVTLYEYGGDNSYYNSKVYSKLTNPVDLGEGGTIQYEVTAVTSDSITVDIPTDASTEVKDALAAMTNYVPVESAYLLTSSSGLNVYSDDRYVLYTPLFDKVDDGAGGFNYHPVTVSDQEYAPLISVPFSNGIGPLFVPNGATEIILNFVSTSGFYKLNGSSEVAVDANIRITNIELDSNGVETGNFTVTNFPYSSNETKLRFSVFQTARIALPYTYSKVFVERTTDRDKSSNVSNVDKIEWRDFYSYEPVSVSSFGDVTTAHVVIPSNSQSRLVKERKQNVDLTRKITQYLGNGIFGTTESYATDDFSQILIHTALDPRIGRLQLKHINADGFLLLKQEILDYFGDPEMIKFGYDFDDAGLTFQDTFIAICKAVMCLPYVQQGVYDAFFEKLQPTSSMQITVRNKLPDSETRNTTYERNNDGVQITYRDNNGGVSNVIEYPTDGSSINPETEDVKGITTELQAYRYALRKYNKQVHRRVAVTFDVDDFGRNVIPGKRIDSPDSTRFTKRPGVADGYRVYDGHVVEVNGLNVELSDPVEFTPGEGHYITFTTETGDISSAILCTRVSDNVVQLSSLPSEAIYDGYSRDKTTYVFASEQLRDSVALIPQTIESNIDTDGVETNTINSINYSDRYYDGDTEYPA
jgi:hypothetical protein